MKEKVIIDAEFWPIKEGRSAKEIRKSASARRWKPTLNSWPLRGR